MKLNFVWGLRSRRIGEIITHPRTRSRNSGKEKRGMEKEGKGREVKGGDEERGGEEMG